MEDWLEINKMIVIYEEDYKKFGCPNCGCATWKAENIYSEKQAEGICRGCGIKYQIISDDLKVEDIQLNKKITPLLCVKHPKSPIPAWYWEAPDDPIDDTHEYFESHGIENDLVGFVRSKASGERLLNMVKQVTGSENPKSFLKYDKKYPDFIMFIFKKEEFYLRKLHEKITKVGGIISLSALQECYHAPFVWDNKREDDNLLRYGEVVLIAAGTMQAFQEVAKQLSYETGTKCDFSLFGGKGIEYPWRRTEFDYDTVYSKPKDYYDAGFLCAHFDVDKDHFYEVAKFIASKDFEKLLDEHFNNKLFVNQKFEKCENLLEMESRQSNQSFDFFHVIATYQNTLSLSPAQSINLIIQ